jgi:uncharacterized membrane protein YphA (DoxX/SURF4 family)
MNTPLGRTIYALAAIASGICALVFRDVNALNSVPHRHVLAFVVAALEILGGLAVFFPRTLRIGTLTLIAVYLAFACVALPFILKQPNFYNNWGNFFEQLSLSTGAVILFALATHKPTLARIAYYTFGVCNISFAIEQYVFLRDTAGFVPHWIPPSQMFWAWATTIFFVLAAIGLLTGILARLAAQLDTAMLLLFALLCWLPILIASPHSFFNWSETAETVAIAASAWVVADYLSIRRTSRT